MSTTPVVAPVPVAPAAPTNGVAPVATPAAAAPEPTFEVTVGGKPTKLTRKQIEKFAGKGAFADATVSQTKEALKAIKAREAELAEREGVWDDDEKLEAELLKRGKLDTLARRRMAAKIAEQEMTPEQRRIAELEASNAESAKKLKAADDEKKAQQLTENAKRIQASIETELDSAWKRAEFERGPDAFYAVYEVMQEWSGLGLIDANQPFSAALADRIIEQARENIDGTDKRREAAVMKGLKGAALAKRLGPEVVKEILRFKTEEFRNGGPKPPSGAPASQPKSAQDPGWLSPSDLANKYRGAK